MSKRVVQSWESKKFYPNLKLSAKRIVSFAGQDLSGLNVVGTKFWFGKELRPQDV